VILPASRRSPPCGFTLPGLRIAVFDTLARTIITSSTTWAAVLALYVFGGTALHSFAFTLLVGIVAGTWSTVFVAAPVAALAATALAFHRAFRSAVRISRI
jgi:preprotein translocase subunit SecF